MGNWGYMPNDSDSAQDHFHAAREAAIPAMEKLIKKRVHDPLEKWERIGAVIEALKSGLMLPESMVQQCSHWCDELHADNGWLASWDDEEAITTTVKFMRAEFKALLGWSVQRRQRARRRKGRPPQNPFVRAPSGWLDSKNTSYLKTERAVRRLKSDGSFTGMYAAVRIAERAAWRRKMRRLRRPGITKTSTRNRRKR